MTEVTDLYESLFQYVLTEALFYIISPLLFATCMFVLWRCFRRYGQERNSAFVTLARGFGLIFLSIAVPFATGVFAFVVLGDSADHISELWFELPAALLEASGAVLVMFGTRKLTQQTNFDA